jgi:SAM-dependent methyltransferase
MRPLGPGLSVPPQLQRGKHRNREEWVESGLFAVDVLRRIVGREDLGEVEVLDMGCGTKIVKTLLDNELPVGHYVGIDAAPEVIEWLRANVSDPRFEFHHIDAHNEMYNPDGTPLAEFELLPVGPRRFELICLFSVFTHLAPHDYEAMLRLLRRHAKPDAKLLFSLFINDPDRPSPYVSGIEAALNADDSEVRRRVEAAIARRGKARARSEDPRFVDVVADTPLAIARYERDYALELVEGTGWEVVSLNPPERYIQHHMVCRPV